MGLISPERAKYNLNNRTLSNNEQTTLGAMVEVASDYIQRYTARDFVLTTYTEYHDGNNSPWLFLKQFPVTSITRVSMELNPCFEIKNTSTTNQIATVATTTTGLRLVRIASGTTTTDSTLLWATYTTVSSLITALDAIGSGWDGTAISAYASWPTNLIPPFQGPFDVSNSNVVEIKMHTDILTDYDIATNTGVLTRTPNTDGIHYNTIWPKGHRNIRVTYEAGYSQVPDDVQEACAQLSASLFLEKKRDPGLIMERTADYTYQVNSTTGDFLTPNSRRILDSYRRRRV